jgi:hypothetical protein
MASDEAFIRAMQQEYLRRANTAQGKRLAKEAEELKKKGKSKAQKRGKK